MKRIDTTLFRSLCFILLAGCGVLSCRSQDLSPAWPPGEMKLLENSGGGQVIYGLVPEQSSLSDGIVSLLRMIHAHFGDSPHMARVLKARDGRSLAAFFTVNAKTEADKPIEGLVIVATAPGATLKAAVLYDEEDRFASTEPALLHLLASAGKTRGTGTPSGLDSHAPASLGPFHLDSGGDKSATICLPADWTISQVSAGSLTAKGPHSEIVALGFTQMVLDPGNAEARQLAHTSSFKNVPQAKFPDESNLFTTFIDVLNQLRATNKLPPASFTLISSKKLDPSPGKPRPLQAIYNLDLADGVGTRRGSARIDVLRLSHSPQWALIVSTSSIPLAYAAAEESTVLAIIKSFRLELPVIRSIEDARGPRVGPGGGPGGDPGYWDPDRKDYVFGYRHDSRNCAAIGGPGNDSGWPEKMVESFIVDPPSSQSSVDGSQSDAASKLSDSLLRSHPDLFDILRADSLTSGQDY